MLTRRAPFSLIPCRPAYDIEINDNNWGANFEEGTGLTQAKFETLEP